MVAERRPIDFRFLDEGLGGARKRKREQEQNAESQQNENLMELENRGSNKRQALTEVGLDGDRPVYGRPTYDGIIAGKVSGRKWKTVKTRASSLKVGIKPKSAEEREKTKQVNKAFKERKHELKEQIRLNKIEKRQRKEDAKKRKKENELKSGLKIQKITNPKTLKKMSKKQRKTLRFVDDKS